MDRSRVRVRYSRMDRDELRQKLRADIHQVEADALLPHHRRSALILAAAELDLLDAAVAVGLDDTATVQTWLAEGKLSRPTLAQLATWCVDRDQRFQFVIVQPFVLAQPLPKAGRTLH